MLLQEYSTFAEMLADLNIVSVTFRLVLAVLIGGIIGLERGIKRRPAGFRTYMLVCLGSTLVMLTNQYITMAFQVSDPARLGAQVVSGIGFLGAGTIIVTRHQQVKGLTTAAGLWACACMGLAIGIGFYTGALVSAFLILFIITMMHRLDNAVVSNSRSLEIYLEMGETGKLSDFLTFASENGIQVAYMEIIKSRFEQKAIAALVSLRLPKRHSHYEVIEQFSKLDGVEYVEEV